ncbi:MAG: hypothetical protein AABP62_03650 [Planctomycetota bacterium]
MENIVMNAMNYEQLSVDELAALFVDAGNIIFAGDEVGGMDFRTEANAEAAMGAIGRELLRRGHAGQTILRALLSHENPEVRLYAATVPADDVGFVELEAERVLESLLDCKDGNGWAAHYAHKALARLRRGRVV